jgi:methionyl-tRNA formyltransferase
MKVLFLGTSDSPLVEYLKSVGDEVIATMDVIDVEFLNAHSPDFIVSYGYRHIIKKDVLDRYTDRAINLHIAYLPWNRGADPNFWSFVEDTPKGVTIHYLDEGIDTGDIIAQRKVAFSETDTLRTSYNRLQQEIQSLFKEHWADIRTGKCNREKQKGNGTHHRLKDKERLSHLLTNGWDTPITVLDEYAAETQMSMQFWEKYDAEIEQMRKQN